MPRLAPKVVERRLNEWRRLLRGSVTQARAVLQKILRGQISFSPRADGGLAFRCTTRFDKLFAEIAVDRPLWLPEGAKGREHLGPADTFESDHCRLLERAQQAIERRQVVANPKRLDLLGRVSWTTLSDPGGTRTFDLPERQRLEQNPHRSRLAFVAVAAVPLTLCRANCQPLGFVGLHRA